LLSKFNDSVTDVTVRAERVFLHELEGGCQVPIAGLAKETVEGNIELTGLVGSPDGKILLKETVTGTNYEEVGKEVAARLREQGAVELIQKVKKELES
jgi:hydroxymethylbilane synthase